MLPLEFESLSPDSLLSVWRQNADLSWSSPESVEIGETTISPKTPIWRNLLIEGVDIAKALDEAAAKHPSLVRRLPRGESHAG
jgi:hypothetical protein